MTLPRVAHRAATVLSSLTLAAGALAVTATATAATATAAVAAVHRDATTPGLTADEASWREILQAHPEVEEVWTHSPSMNRDIPLLVLPASTPGAPTVYLLNGVDGGPEDHNWFGQGEAVDFFRARDVNVVVPVDGRNSYYSDWMSASPLDRADRGGLRQQWATYLTRELPGPLEASLDADGTRAILGMSMSATSALQLVEDNPGFYSAAAGLSGCYDTTSENGRRMVGTVVGDDNSGATVDQLWGPADGDYARAHDPLRNITSLRADVQGGQIPLYFSAANGTPTRQDLSDIASAPPSPELALTVAAGTGLELGSRTCTEQLQRALESEGVPARFHYPSAGIHSWSSFAEGLRDAWPTLARGLRL